MPASSSSGPYCIISGFWNPAAASAPYLAALAFVREDASSEKESPSRIEGQSSFFKSLSKS